MSVYDVVSLADVLTASERRFRYELHGVVERFDETVPRSVCRTLATIPRLLVERMAADTPQIRAWMWSVKRALPFFRHEIAEMPMEPVAHLEVDELRRDRIGDLFRYQALGILFGDAVARRSSLDITCEAAAPVRLCVPRVGGFDLSTVADPPSISSSHAGLKIRCGSSEAVVEPDGTIRTQGLIRLEPSMLVSIGGEPVEIPVYDPSLTQWSFQSMPLLRGVRGVSAWCRRIEEADWWLRDLEVPNSDEIVRLCRSVLGLVSLSDSFGSASREQALGLVYLPANRSRPELAESLLHEAFHQLLFRIEEATPLFTPETDARELYFSPWRPDPRPLRMALHGAFVFTAVADLYQRCLDRRDTGVDRWEAATMAYRRCREVLDALAVVGRYATPTNVGAAVIGGIDRKVRSILDNLELAVEERDEVDAEIEAHCTAHADFLH